MSATMCERCTTRRVTVIWQRGVVRWVCWACFWELVDRRRMFQSETSRALKVGAESFIMEFTGVATG